MATILANGLVRFGDNTQQSTATPANVSAFANDSGYLTSGNTSATYAARSTTVYTVGGSAQRRFTMYYYDVNGTQIGTLGTFNCNCNC